ncbi:MAG: hypothetical protein P8X70_02135, partial [Nanoarchaeota archaeon]
MEMDKMRSKLSSGPLDIEKMEKTEEAENPEYIIDKATKRVRMVRNKNAVPQRVLVGTTGRQMLQGTAKAV